MVMMHDGDDDGDEEEEWVCTNEWKLAGDEYDMSIF